MHTIQSQIFKPAWFYRAIGVIALVILYRTILLYTESLMGDYEEETALFFSLSFFAGIYAGGFLVRVGIFQKHNQVEVLVTRLLLVIIICTICVALGIEFRPENRLVLSLLLAGLPYIICSVAGGMLAQTILSNVSNRLTKANVTAEHSRSELRLLQSQLSPHFLFNTLNNLYGLSIKRNEMLPALLLKLSDLLRYSVYEAKELFVPLRDELNYIHNYIDFEKIRIGNVLVINVHIDDIGQAPLEIASMVFIVFIENAFKHAKNTLDKHIYIDIELKLDGNRLDFMVRNSFSEQANDESVVNEHSGIGLSNTVRRLDLLYGKKYKLDQKINGGFYTINLTLEF